MPGLADRNLVADLDLLMTVEKAVLVGVPAKTIIRGLRTDEEIRVFAESLSRRFARCAFPDDFVAAICSIQK